MYERTFFFAPNLQNIDSLKLFPYLQRSSLLSIDDVDYISNPKRTENERRKRIIVSAPCRDPDAFDRFLDCLSVERNHSGHAYLAKRMREAIKRKRENPFSKMGMLHIHVQPMLFSVLSNKIGRALIKSNNRILFDNNYFFFLTALQCFPQHSYWIAGALSLQCYFLFEVGLGWSQNL